MEIPVLASLALDISSQNLKSYVERCLLCLGVRFSDLEYSNYINSYIAHGSRYFIDFGQESISMLICFVSEGKNVLWMTSIDMKLVHIYMHRTLCVHFGWKVWEIKPHNLDSASLFQWMLDIVPKDTVRWPLLVTAIIASTVGEFCVHGCCRSLGRNFLAKGVAMSVEMQHSPLSYCPSWRMSHYIK